MRSKKNSSLILLGVFTLGVTQSCVVEALPETSANLAKESDNESKQQDIDVKQGTDVKSVDSKNGEFLYTNSDKKTKNMSINPTPIWGGVATSVAGLSAAIFVKKMLDSKQDNSNENNEDSERDKKADNQDSKDEVKNPDSNSISSLPFVILGVVAIVVVGTIVYFVCKGKRENISLQHQQTSDTSTNKKSNNVNESSFVSESKNEFSVNKPENKFEEKKLGSEPKEESNNVNEFSFVSESKNESSFVNKPEDKSEVKKLGSEPKEESNNVNEFEEKKLDNKLKLFDPEVEEKVEELYELLKNINVNVSNVWTLEKLKKIFADTVGTSVLEILLKKDHEELKNTWFCDENAENEKNLNLLFSTLSGEDFIKFSEGKLRTEKINFLSLLIKAKHESLLKLVVLFDDLFYDDDFDIGPDEFDLNTEIAGILLEESLLTEFLYAGNEFIRCFSHHNLSKMETIMLNFTAAILTGKYKNGQKSFKVNMNFVSKNFKYMFGSSAKDNLNALLNFFKTLEKDKKQFANFLFTVAEKYYNECNPEQQQQVHNEDNSKDIIIKQKN